MDYKKWSKNGIKDHINIKRAHILLQGNLNYSPFLSVTPFNTKGRLILFYFSRNLVILFLSLSFFRKRAMFIFWPRVKLKLENSGVIYFSYLPTSSFFTHILLTLLKSNYEVSSLELQYFCSLGSCSYLLSFLYEFRYSFLLFSYYFFDLNYGVSSFLQRVLCLLGSYM